MKKFLLSLVCAALTYALSSIVLMGFAQKNDTTRGVDFSNINYKTKNTPRREPVATNLLATTDNLISDYNLLKIKGLFMQAG